MFLDWILQSSKDLPNFWVLTPDCLAGHRGSGESDGSASGLVLCPPSLAIADAEIGGWVAWEKYLRNDYLGPQFWLKKSAPPALGWPICLPWRADVGFEHPCRVSPGLIFWPRQVWLPARLHFPRVSEGFARIWYGIADQDEDSTRDPCKSDFDCNPLASAWAHSCQEVPLVHKHHMYWAGGRNRRCSKSSVF